MLFSMVYDTILFRSRYNALPAHAFLEAGVAGIADDDVVEQFDVEQFAGGNKLVGDLDIFRAWSRVA